MKRYHWCSLAALVCLQACTPGVHGPTVIKALPDRSDAVISTATDQGLTAIEVTSPSGIGNARIEIESGPIPKRIVLRFFLKGVEHLELVYGQTTIVASLSSSSGHGVSEALRPVAPGEEQELSSDSAYWMAVTIVPTAGLPATIPLQEGYIEVQLPKDFFASNQRSFSIGWIDFYR